jgi:hypothetical protein
LASKQCRSSCGSYTTFYFFSRSHHLTELFFAFSSMSRVSCFQYFGNLESILIFSGEVYFINFFICLELIPIRQDDANLTRSTTLDATLVVSTAKSEQCKKFSVAYRRIGNPLYFYGLFTILCHTIIEIQEIFLGNKPTREPTGKMYLKKKK